MGGIEGIGGEKERALMAFCTHEYPQHSMDIWEYTTGTTTSICSRLDA